MGNLFKLGMALVFAVIAALVIFITGLLSDARVTTACLRSLVGFLCAGLFSYLIAFILEAKGWAAFDKDPVQRMEDMQRHLYGADEIDFERKDESDEGSDEEFSARTDFRPLEEESFVHMRTPSEENDAAEGEPAPA